jgi:hypothetical protein
VLLELEGKAVAVEQGNILATSFHPELPRFEYPQVFYPQDRQRIYHGLKIKDT